jgi:chromosome segregation ATPase
MLDINDTVAIESIPDAIEQIEELLRLNDRLDARIAELEEVTAAVTVLVNWVNKDKADNADLEDRIDGLETEQNDLSSNVEEVRSDLDRANESIQVQVIHPHWLHGSHVAGRKGCRISGPPRYRGHYPCPDRRRATQRPGPHRPA